MAVKPVLICDICHSDEAVGAYRIVFPDEAVWETDLCSEHQGVLEQFREKGWGHEARARGRRRVFEVTSLEELQTQISKKGRKRS